MFRSGMRLRCLLFWPSRLRARLPAGSPRTRESRRWSGGDSGGSEPSELLVGAGRAARPAQSKGPGAPRLSGVGLGSLRGDRAGDRPLFPSLTTLHTSFQPPASLQVPAQWSCLFFQPRALHPDAQIALEAASAVPGRSPAQATVQPPPRRQLWFCRKQGGQEGSKVFLEPEGTKIIGQGRCREWFRTSVGCEGPRSGLRPVHVARVAAPELPTRSKSGDNREDG